jgi:hypothetical protein
MNECFLLGVFMSDQTQLTGTLDSEPLSDEEVLLYTQRKRKELVEDVTQRGMPADNKDRLTLLAALDGMDRAALAGKKIESKEKTSSADREAQYLIAKLHGNLQGRDPFKVDPADGQVVANRQLHLDESGLDPLVVAPGETEVGIMQENAQTFLDRYENNM